MNTTGFESCPLAEALFCTGVQFNDGLSLDLESIALSSLAQPSPQSVLKINMHLLLW